MVRYFAACLLAVVPGMAAAQPVAGPSYSEGQIRAWSVAGVHLGMTEDEAKIALQQGEFEGEFARFTADERQATFWVKLDQKAAPFRFLARDGKVRIATMMFEQRFDRPQSIQALEEIVTTKYGPATETETYPEGGKLVYHVPYAVNHGSVDSACWPRYEPNCTDAQRATMKREESEPRLTVTLTRTSIRADLSDNASREEGEAAAKAAADAERERKALANTQATKLGL